MSKAAKQRVCPATGGEISTKDCGEYRNSRYACPPDCPHNPLAPANYSQLLALEAALDNKSVNWMLEHAADPDAMERGMKKALEHPAMHSTHAFVSWRFLFRRDADGLTCAGRWERDGFSGLKNDERVLLRAKMRMFVALLEVHCVLDTEGVEVVDLWEPEAGSFVIRDRSLASVAVRFSTFLGWNYRLPHFVRLSGTVLMLPEIGLFEPTVAVNELVRHLGGPSETGARRLWLAEHFVRFDDAVGATARARRRQMFEHMDVQTGKAVYEPVAPLADCLKILDREPDVAPESLTKEEKQEGFTQARVWFDDASAVSHALPPGGRQAIGRVLAGPARWRLETFSAGRLDKLRSRFEALLGKRVRFRSEMREDLARQMALKEPGFDPALVPPRLLEQPPKIQMTTSRVPGPPAGCSGEDYEAALMMAQDREFLKDSIPALDGHTPREAARDPALRPRLIRLLKNRVLACDEHNLRTGRSDDINWLLRELDATEILFDPPPPRPPPRLATNKLGDANGLLDGDSADDGLEEDDASAGGLDLPDPPRLPAEPLTMEEALSRLETAMDAFDTAAEAMDALRASGSTLLEDLDALVGDALNDDEWGLLVPFVLQLWLALVPPGCRGPVLEWESLQNAFDQNAKRLLHCLNHGKPSDLQRFLESARQPSLMCALTGSMLETAHTGPKKLRPRMGSEPVILAVLKTLVDELDLALRG